METSPLISMEFQFRGGLGLQIPWNFMETTSSNSHGSLEEVPWNSPKLIKIIINIYIALFIRSWDKNTQ